MRRYPQGLRVWVFGQRIHHGATGVTLCAAAIRTRSLRLAALGALLALHDRADWRVWFARELLPASVTHRTQLPIDSELSRP